MKYFFDTEFLEGPQKILFGLANSRPTIDLISIGIVSEDGRKYYAVSKDFNLKEAWNRFQWKDWNSLHNEKLFQKEYWIRENVLLPIYREFIHGDMRNHYDFSYSTMKWLLEVHGKTNKQIAEDILKFTKYEYNFETECGAGIKRQIDLEEEGIQFYAYYGDYDWVAFCWLFGKMIDLPKKFPMYCRDLKQMLDEKVNLLNNNDFFEHFHEHKSISLEQKLRVVKNINDYPTQDNAHNALDDAIWNYKLYQFIQKL